ncbi:uncharacterized protein [Ptychodera flava]|uniref:uncharacterized protein n=1 Tax=Ptychodera flava TaxID=63121 RepID=UPI00396AAA2F
MLRVAGEADAMVSIGPSMYDYFENAYRAHEEIISHFLLLPKTGERYNQQRVTQQKDIRQLVILSYGEIRSDIKEVLSEYDGVAAAVHGIASSLKGTGIKHVTWNIVGVAEEHVENVQNHLYTILKSSSVQVNIVPHYSINDLITMLRQCHVCLLSQIKVDYGFLGLESIAIGVPTYLNGQSQLGYYISDFFKDDCNQCLVEGDTAWGEKVMQVATNGMEYKRASKLKDRFTKSGEIEESYARIAALFTEEPIASEGLDVDIALDIHNYFLHQQKLMDQLKALSRQHPIDESRIVTIKTRVQEIDDAVKRFKQLFDLNAKRVANDDGTEVSRIMEREKLGAQETKNLHTKSLGMAVNFLGILYLYRFKSACHNGRFAKAFEPLLITDEMRELAKRFNIPLKLKATYDQQQFDRIDQFFCKRDGLHRLDGQFAQQGVQRKMPAEGDDIHGRLGQMTQFEDVKKGNVGRASDIDILTKDVVEEYGQPGDVDQKPNFEDAVLEASGIPYITDTKLLAFKSDKDQRFVPSAEMYLPTIFNVDNYTALRGDQWDFIQFMVKMTEKIQHILSTRQEILSVLGVREFFVTDTDCDTHDLYGLADQFLKHGRAPLCIKSSAKPYSLSARSLIPYKVSHTLLDKEGQRSLELDQTDWHEALKLVLKYREEDITKLMGNLSIVENRVRQLEGENTAQNQAVQEKRNLELHLKHAKQEVEIVQGLLKTEKEKLKRAEKACSKATLAKNNLEQRLESAEKEVVKVQDMNKKQQSELVGADEKIKSQLVRIKELESKGKQSEIPRVDKSTCTPSLPEETLEQISEVISIGKVMNMVSMC